MPEVFGKRIVITDRSDWSDEEILLAYRGQSHVEDAFRQLKDDEHMAMRPQYHWTDQKIRDAIENLKGLVGVSGVFNFSPEDHNGLGPDAFVMVRIENGTWKLVE